ncbi:MAG TPA: hypothetical protein VEC99_11620, partial [Clostridia bacterium]|nr:hypothetical protein [Clostridia bacterium]
RQLTFQETARMQNQQQQELQQFKQRLELTRLDGKRLDRVEDIMRERRQAEVDLKRLKSPVGTVKRLFSGGAREELRLAEARVTDLDAAGARYGVKNEEDFKEQRAKWQREQAKAPALEESMAGISKTLERIARALEGFHQEHERDLLEQYRRKRSRGRDDDYGRGR